MSTLLNFLIFEKKKPSSPSPFSQIWEKGSRKEVPLPRWERDLG